MKQQFIMPELGYSMNALTPYMSAQTLEYHYGKHFKAYIDNLNAFVPGTEWDGKTLEEIAAKASGKIGQNAGQAWNHQLFFEQFRPGKTSKQLSTKLQAAINQSFGSIDELHAQMKMSAAGLFGSGWVWLVEDDHQQLAIKPLSNDDNPLRHGWKPLLVIDVWEHAYYLDYQNRRAEFVDKIWQIINWDVVSQRIAIEAR